MSAVELGRVAAARLHDEMRSAGADPWAPLAIVCAAARSLRVDIEDVEPGAAVLKNAQALYDPATRTILYAAGGSPFSDAFLIAHEIGHLVLGDDQDEDQTLDVDPARESEAAPVGEERVIDYSRRSRREVQMDLFARELILPRPWARTLHVDDHRTAGDIALGLGAPFDFVAQQLFDALLLPPQTAPGVPREPPPLNTAQRRAADHLSGPFLLEAGPGTGKTQTLSARVRTLIERQVDPRKVLVLTFSNKAAGELAERISAQMPEAAVAAWIGTFHGFGRDLVRRYHGALGFSREPRLMDRTEAVELLEAEMTRLGLVHYRDLWDPTDNLRAILSAISRAQDEVVDPETYAERARAMSASDPVGSEKALEVANVYARYQAIKLERQCVDFGDLVTLPVRLLQEHPAVRAELQGRYEHILVDEYQDVNRSSVALLTLLLGPERNLWVVGDARQSVYRFRGASSFNMARFGHEDFPEACRDRLDINYRSGREIVDAFGTFGAAMRCGTSSGQLAAHRGSLGHPPEHCSVRVKPEESAGIARTIAEAHRQGYSYRNQAVLCSGNDRLTRLGAELERRGIPVLHLGSLFERPEIRDLLSWLSLLIDPRAAGLARARSPSALNPGLADVSLTLDSLRQSNLPPLGWTTHAASGVSEAGQSVISSLRTVLEGFRPDQEPWTVLAKLLLDRTRLAADLALDGGVVARSRAVAIWQFLNFVRSQPRAQGLPIRRLLDRVRRLVRLSDEGELRHLPEAAQSIDAVRLMTIHGSKGLEFDVVHIAGLNAQTLPRSASPSRCPPPDGMIVGAAGSGSAAAAAAHDEEQECLFYVALSRARDRLFLHSVREKIDGRARAASAYLDRLGPVGRRVLDLAGEVLDDEDMVPIPLVLTQPLVLSLAQLELYNRCPRRFFYTHVLGVGGRRTATPFTELHDVVQAVVGHLCDPSGPQDAGQAFDEAWAGTAVSAHAFAGDYRVLARQLIDRFTESRQGRVSSGSGSPLRLAAASGEVRVVPDETLEDATGIQISRRIRTGKRPSSASRLGEAAFILSSGPGGRTEFVYLGDSGEPVVETLTPTVGRNRMATIEEALADIAAGRFPMKESAFSCPACPSFFICGPVPPGRLEKNLTQPLPVPPS